MPERQLANLFLEQLNDLIWIIDSNFCLKYANQAYQNIMKQVTGEEKKLNEHILVEGFGDGYIEKWKAYYKRGLNGEHFEIKDQFYNPYTNQVEYSEISFKPLTDENQEIVNVACQSRDITSLTKSIGSIKDITYNTKHEKELLELNNILKTKLAEIEIAYEELEQFAYIASHDLQEPLRMISSFMDQLKRKYGEQLDGKANQYIEFAIDGAKRMKQIILDLLEYSRAGKIQEEPQNIEVKQILDEYKILRRKVITEKKVIFETGGLPMITAYNTPLVQVMHNLIDNAIKYSKNDENPVVKITCIHRQEFWEFCIEDNGIGIDEKYFTKIFIIFQRLQDRDNYSGTGIGLSIVKKQIETLGGKIWIESKVNVGSKFYFTIPK